MQRIIPVSQGILTNEHIDRLGSAWAEFLWLIDRITKIDSAGKGIVLGGKPIKWQDFGFGTRRTIQRHVQHLEKEKYIETKRAPYGLIISIHKAKKVFGQRFLEKQTNQARDVTKVAHPDVPKMTNRYAKSGASLVKSGASNKDNNIDNNGQERERSQKYLLNIPTEDIPGLMLVCSATERQVRSKGEQLYDWCLSSGKRKKDYKATLRNALRKDYPKTSSFDDTYVLSA